MSSFSNPLTEYSPQLEFSSGSADAYEDESGTALFDESQELELTSRLLEVVNEPQLDRFVRELIRQAAAARESGVRAPEAAAIGDVLKNAVRQVLPIARAQHGSSLHNAVGMQLGNGLSSVAGQVLGLELEGLSPEDREFEAVRQFVRFAGVTVKNALDHSSESDPYRTANRAAADAAAVYAPGLLPQSQHLPRDSGRWVAFHDRIILFGV